MSATTLMVILLIAELALLAQGSFAAFLGAFVCVFAMGAIFTSQDR